MFRPVFLICKAVLRDSRLRRSAMMWIMLVALVMMFLGSWLMPDDWGRRHFALYFLYWAVCAWLTITAVLLAVFDILVIRAQARVLRRRIEQDIAHIDAKTNNAPKGERQ